jgi:hypothetical protein
VDRWHLASRELVSGRVENWCQKSRGHEARSGERLGASIWEGQVEEI